ncbi:MAG: hypothetical protein HOW73_31720 [Polyangiaceae bacterium]|nr:hypothetical protein [Polyangiaceae bacterium]
MLGLLKRWFRTEGPPPLLVRLRDSSGFVEGAVELTAIWRPSGRRQTTISRAAQGLCIIPWGGGSNVELLFAHPSGHAKVEALASDAELGEARVVYLRPADAAGVGRLQAGRLQAG